jgi:enoyl-CoA hydratase
MYKHILVRPMGEVTWLTINREPKLNAINAETRREISSALTSIGKSREAKCVILMGAGTQAFSVGEDLEETLKLRDVTCWIKEWQKFLEKLMTLPQPIVTASNGYTVGAGWQMFLLGDYRLCSPSTVFALPEVKAGLPSIMGAALIKMMSGGFAQLGRIALLGERVDPREALKMGLVHEIVPRSLLKKTALKIARKLATQPARAVVLQRAWMQKRIRDSFRQEVADASSIYSDAFASGEPKRRIVDFLKAR